MKNVSFLLIALTIASLLIGACTAVPATPTVAAGGGKVEAIPVAFIGTVESMAGDQWVINGNTVTVDPAIIRDGPFNVGDQVKVEGVVSPDGSFAVSRVEAPTTQDLSSLPPFGSGAASNDNTNDANINDSNVSGVNTNDGNVNDGNVNDGNTNDDNTNAGNVNGDNSNDDNGGNSNDDNGNDDNGSNSNDDSGGNDGNGNDDDDDSGGGGGNSGGGNDNDDD